MIGRGCPAAAQLECRGSDTLVRRRAAERGVCKTRARSLKPSATFSQWAHANPDCPCLHAASEPLSVREPHGRFLVQVDISMPAACQTI